MSGFGWVCGSAIKQSIAMLRAKALAIKEVRWTFRSENYRLAEEQSDCYV
jgi:hypothetical protein